MIQDCIICGKEFSDENEYKIVLNVKICLSCYNTIGEKYKEENELMDEDEANEHAESVSANRRESYNDLD